MPSHKNDPSCHCAVCHDGYSRIDSTSTSLTRGPSLRTAGTAGTGTSAITLNSECLSSGRGSPGAASKPVSGVATTLAGVATGPGQGVPLAAASARAGQAASTKARPRPTGAGVARRSALADKYMYSDLTYEPEPEPIVELEEPCVELECDDSDLHKVAGRVEPYLPQPEDDAHPADPAAAAPMGPVGPWAQGKPDWGPLAGLTGTRPVVDRYSLTRFSVPEWRKENLSTLERAAGDNHNAGMVDFNGRACMQHMVAEADKNQADCTSRLQQRAMDVHRWLADVRRAHKALWDEIQTLDAHRGRLHRLLCTLTKCASVAGQCLDVRAKRADPDLVRDEPEEELVKEVALIDEVRELVKRCLQQVEDQQKSSKAAKARMSTNWSDKQEAYDVDTYCGSLRTGAPSAMFREGATRFPDGQSTTESWEVASREDICLSENERAKSAMLRNLIDAMVHDAARDLRVQEARVDEAVQRRVQVVAALLQELESQLALVLRRIVETEQLIEQLKTSLRQLDMALKVAQTRLQSRMERKRIENTRDLPQYGLVDEVKSISEQCSAILGQLKQAEIALQSLTDTRNHLEKAIVQKRKSLHADRDRVQVIRQHYPPATALTGQH